MYNWNTDTKLLKKDKVKYAIWKLNQLINFGLNGEKLDLELVKKHWFQIYTDDPTKKFLRLLLWGKQS